MRAAHPHLKPGRVYRTRELSRWGANTPRLAKRLALRRETRSSDPWSLRTPREDALRARSAHRRRAHAGVPGRLPICFYRPRALERPWTRNDGALDRAPRLQLEAYGDVRARRSPLSPPPGSVSGGAEARMVRHRPPRALRTGGGIARRSRSGTRTVAANWEIRPKLPSGHGRSLRHQENGSARRFRARGRRSVSFVHEDPDFDGLVRIAARKRRLSSSLVEKDYEVRPSASELEPVERAIALDELEPQVIGEMPVHPGGEPPELATPQGTAVEVDIGEAHDQLEGSRSSLKLGAPGIRFPSR